MPIVDWVRKQLENDDTSQTDAVAQNPERALGAEQNAEAQKADENCCALGAWINGPGKQFYANLQEFEALRQAHAHFHGSENTSSFQYRLGNAPRANTPLRSKLHSATHQNPLELIRHYSAVKKQSSVDLLPA